MRADGRADLAEAMVPVGCQLACAVRDDPAEVARILRQHRTRLDALAVVLAAMVPVDETPEHLLSWVDWPTTEPETQSSPSRPEGLILT